MALYYDIDDIMMGEELSDLQKSSPKGQLKLISVVFQVGANGIGLLDPGSETNRIEKGAKVDLPFWLAHELYLRQAVGVQLPAAYNQKTRKEIQADAACVDLKSRCPYFYELGCMIAPLVIINGSLGGYVVSFARLPVVSMNGGQLKWRWANERVSLLLPHTKVRDRTIGSFLLYTFVSRYKEILSKAHRAALAAVPKFFPLLTREESHLFEAAHSSMAAFKKWRLGGSRLERASVLGRKRKSIGEMQTPTL